MITYKLFGAQRFLINNPCNCLVTGGRGERSLIGEVVNHIGRLAEEITEVHIKWQDVVLAM